MVLFHLDLGGSGLPPLVILHGLLGSSRNWRLAGADLARRFHVFALDLRNHGKSPHAPEQSFDLMVADVLEWLDGHGLGRTSLIGHSLGGKVAMRLACRAPERLSLLYVVDIAPRPYAVDSSAFEALLRLNLKELRTRSEADELLRRDIPDRGTRQFVLTNLVRKDGANSIRTDSPTDSVAGTVEGADRDAVDEGPEASGPESGLHASERGCFAWQVNLPVLAAALPALRRSSLEPWDRFTGRTLFIAGGRSRFLREEDRPAIAEHFPYARVQVLGECGHYPHVEDRAAFVKAVVDFAASASGSVPVPDALGPQ